VIKRPTRVRLAACSALTLGLVLSACGQSSAPASTTNLGDIKIGGLYPLSGTNASAGQDTLNGVKLAAEVLNGQHAEVGLPKLTVGKIVLDSADTQGNPETGASDVDRLVTTDKVVALMGAYQSAVSLTASQRGERYGVPFVNGSSSSTQLTKRGLKWFFRTGPSDLTFVQTYFAWLHSIARDHPVHKVVVFHTNDTFGNDGAAVIKQLAPGNSTSVTDDISFPTGPADLTSQVQKLRNDAPDAVFVLMFTNDAVLFTKTMATLGYTPPAILAIGAGYADPKFVTALGAKADYAITRAAWSAEIGQTSKTAKAVADAFEKEFGQPMTENSAREFTAMMTLGAAIESARSLDPEKLRAALAGINIKQTIMPWKGVKFDAEGQNSLATGVIEQMISGQYKVLFPAAYSSTKVVWPAPDLTTR